MIRGREELRQGEFEQVIDRVRSSLSKEEWMSRDNLLVVTELDGFRLSIGLRHLVDNGVAEAEKSVARSSKGRLTKGWRLKNDAFSESDLDLSPLQTGEARRGDQRSEGGHIEEIQPASRDHAAEHAILQ